MARLSETVPDCIHRETSDEACLLYAGSDRMEKANVYLCNWPEAHPEYFVNAPRWIQKKAYPGIAITPETDCIGCPGRTALQEDGDG